MASKTHEDEVFHYVVRNSETMPRVTLRYAMEKMPEDRHRQAMGKR